MTTNIGTVDRIIRLVLAVAVAILYVTGAISGLLAVILGVLAAVFLLTGVIGVCPLYAVLHLSTVKK
jgi:hypothetical protein